MSGVVGASEARNRWLAASSWRRMFRDRPIIPLLVLLALLVVLSELARPGIVNPAWGGVILRTAVPLAILAGCQTLTMLTGGIDLSVGSVASMSGFLVATLVGDQGLVFAILAAVTAAALAGLLTGIGVGVFRVHPLIMTLGMGLVVFGFSNAWQLVMVQTGGGTPPELRTLGSGSFLGIVPHSLVVFLPLARADPRRTPALRLRAPAVRGRGQSRGRALVGSCARGRSSSSCTSSRRSWPRSPGSCCPASRTSPA